MTGGQMDTAGWRSPNERVVIVGFGLLLKFQEEGLPKFGLIPSEKASSIPGRTSPARNNRAKGDLLGCGSSWLVTFSLPRRVAWRPMCVGSPKL